MLTDYIKAAFMLVYLVAVYGLAVPQLVSASSDTLVFAGVMVGLVGALPPLAYGRRTYLRIKAHADREATKRELNL